MEIHQDNITTLRHLVQNTNSTVISVIETSTNMEKTNSTLPIAVKEIEKTVGIVEKNIRTKIEPVLQDKQEFEDFRDQVCV